MTNSLHSIQGMGQSVWLDYIRRDLLTNGQMAQMVREDGVGGMTSNPAIFEKAMTSSTDYMGDLKKLARQGLDPKAVYEQLAIKDIQDAADILRPVYDRTKQGDGYVSLEVSPHLARDTKGTLEEARRLWQAVGRANLMIKVPGTPEGIPAVQQLIREGLNINITLLFAQERYAEVAEAYLRGLEQRAADGADLAHVASVASFFISRIDTLVDKMLGERLKASADPKEQATLRSLMGKVAIANGKQTYQRYRKIFSGTRWDALASKGAKKQRVLWASTSTKNPEYRDVLYIEELIGADTVNTMPPATFEAFRDHGKARQSLEEDLEAANRTMESLARAGISMQEVTDALLEEAIRLFTEPFDKLLETIRQQCAKVGS